jgi:TorA maturation chaperone TorD
LEQLKSALISDHYHLHGWRASERTTEWIYLLRDTGLDRAISAAGGMRSLARTLGVSQPAISGWKRVPADRVLSVESVTGVPRADLRPDLYPVEQNLAAASVAQVVDEIDLARAAIYNMLGALLWRAPTADVLAQLGDLRGDASPFGMAQVALAEAAKETTGDAVASEFFALFIGVGRGELLPYASYYLTGFLHEKPLAAVRADMEKLGLARTDRVMEPEDHCAILFDVMANLLRGNFTAEGMTADAFFMRHIQPWAGRLFADLEIAGASYFYKSVGRAGGVFLDIETEAMRLSS